MRGRSDEDLVAAHKGGDRRAFDELVARHEGMVWRVALHICGNVEDAQDVAQDTFVSALRTLGTFKEKARLSTWLYRIATNKALDLLRRRASRAAPLPLHAAESREDPAPGPLERAVAQDRAAEVHRAIAELPPLHRAIVLLADVEGLDYAEISEVLDIPRGTVGSRLNRGRLELARKLDHLRVSLPMEFLEAEPPLTGGENP